MYSVTGWIASEKFPTWKFNLYVSEKSLGECKQILGENLSASRIGVLVDYLTRLAISNDFDQSFITIKHAFKILMSLSSQNPEEIELIKKINEEYLYLFEQFRNKKENWKREIFENDTFIKIAAKFTVFDTYFRSKKAISPEIINIDKQTIEIVRTLIKRILNFLKNNYKQIVCGGKITSFTTKITEGDWDFLSTNDLIDIKINKDSSSRKKHWIQLIVYYLLCKEANDFRFEKVKNLTIFNPKLNRIYTIKIEDIPKEIFQTIKDRWGEVKRIVKKEEIEKTTKFHSTN